MALTQMQIIQSLGEAMAWFERELSWGVPATELRHLCGRIGELYVALITNGQMATDVNQRGYDVVGSDGERISVKTTAMMGAGGHISFNLNSLSEVDRIIVLRVNTEEMQVETLYHAPKDEAVRLMGNPRAGRCDLPLSRLLRPQISYRNIPAIRQVNVDDYIVRELESGTIEVERHGQLIVPAKSMLRELAMRLNLPLVNANGNELNTRQLGSQIIRNVTAPTDEPPDRLT